MERDSRLGVPGSDRYNFLLSLSVSLALFVICGRRKTTERNSSLEWFCIAAGCWLKHPLTPFSSPLAGRNSNGRTRAEEGREPAGVEVRAAR